MGISCDRRCDCSGGTPTESLIANEDAGEANARAKTVDRNNIILLLFVFPVERVSARTSKRISDSGNALVRLESNMRGHESPQHFIVTSSWIL